jgi:hypothetical protein
MRHGRGRWPGARPTLSRESPRSPAKTSRDRGGSYKWRRRGYLQLSRDVALCDFLFLCTDTITSRLVANALVHSHHVPMIQVGAKVDLRSDGGMETVYAAVRPVFRRRAESASTAATHLYPRPRVCLIEAQGSSVASSR